MSCTTPSSRQSRNAVLSSAITRKSNAMPPAPVTRGATDWITPALASRARIVSTLIPRATRSGEGVKVTFQTLPVAGGAVTGGAAPGRAATVEPRPVPVPPKSQALPRSAIWSSTCGMPVRLRRRPNHPFQGVHPVEKGLEAACGQRSSVIANRTETAFHLVRQSFRLMKLHHR